MKLLNQNQTQKKALAREMAHLRKMRRKNPRTNVMDY